MAGFELAVPGSWFRRDSAVPHRQLDNETRTLPTTIPGLDAPAGGFDDGPGDRKSHPPMAAGPAAYRRGTGAGGKPGLENSLDKFPRNAASGVLERKNHRAHDALLVPPLGKVE